MQIINLSYCTLSHLICIVCGIMPTLLIQKQSLICALNDNNEKVIIGLFASTYVWTTVLLVRLVIFRVLSMAPQCQQEAIVTTVERHPSDGLGMHWDVLVRLPVHEGTYLHNGKEKDTLAYRKVNLLIFSSLHIFHDFPWPLQQPFHELEKTYRVLLFGFLENVWQQDVNHEIMV